jgi:serine protease AprX
MDKVSSFKPEILDDNKTGVGAGEVVTYQVNVMADGGKLRLNLVYTDFPATAAAQKTLVNNLDIEVIDQSGNSFSRGDSVNNTEMVEVTGLSRGTYTVKVKGTNVPQGLNGKQPFALVASIQP